MNKTEWERFCAAKKQFKQLCEAIKETTPGLAEAQQNLVNNREGPEYPIETSVVYNNALEDVTADDKISLILVADNPGRREQSKIMRRYLVGPSGKIAENFFNKEASLNINFRKNVVILNKTPIHTPRTVCLRTLSETSPQIDKAVIASQKQMAALLVEFYHVLKTPIWIIGYSEMKKNGVFEAYTKELYNFAANNTIDINDIYFFRHFSMNQFAIDLNKQRQPGEAIQHALERIGIDYRKRILY